VSNLELLMPALDHDRILKLDPDEHNTMLAARIAERDAAILARDAARKQARATAKDGAGAKSATDAKAAKDAALTTASTHEATFADKVAEVKVKHSCSYLGADEGHDIVSGTWVLKAESKLQGLAPIIDRTLPLDDKQCDEFVASYRASVRAGFEGMDLQRQVNEYEAAHPKVDGEPGKLIPEPQALLDLRKALADKQDVVKGEQAKQATIFAAVLAAAGEKAGDYTYTRMSTDGEIVLGRNPLATKHDEVVLEPKDGDGKAIK
jgi:hypothetical protein